jgi:hypothetical protein
MKTDNTSNEEDLIGRSIRFTTVMSMRKATATRLWEIAETGYDDIVGN